MSREKEWGEKKKKELGGRLAEGGKPRDNLRKKTSSRKSIYLGQKEQLKRGSKKDDNPCI